MALSQNSHFSVEINGLLARVDFTQTFKNSSDETLEAIYVFPLSDDAAVDHMTMDIGERRIIGEIKEKKQAKKIYQSALKKGKKASLVSQQRPNMFTTKVANIAPNEVVKINISYLQGVNFADDRFSIRLPLTITERFIPQPHPEGVISQSKKPIVEDEVNEMSQLSPVIKTTAIINQGWALNNSRVPDATFITPPQISHSLNQKATLNLTIKSQLPLIDVSSVYHRIKQSKQNDNVVVSLKDTAIPLDRDFELQWQLAEGETPAAAFFSQTDDHFNYGLLMVVPPQNEQHQVIAKEVVYIIDTSGSMGGVAIQQAKQALTQAVAMLNDNDLFNIIEFNSRSRPLFTLSQKATRHFRDRATQWISRLQAGGGTNMRPAINLALKQSPNAEIYENIKQRQVVFITDGAVGNETELFNVIEKKLKNTRLHTIGIGSAPNGYFMSQAAEVGKGTFRYISNINEVNQKMTKLFHEINRPMMTNISVDWPSNDVEMFPQHIPDLYAGNPLLVAIKWAKDSDPSRAESLAVNINGQLANQLWQQKIKVTAVDNAMNTNAENKLNNGVGTWWARKKIKHLNTQSRRSSHAQKNKYKEEITQLALHHQLLSPFTSFVAVEEVIPELKESSITKTQVKSKAVPNFIPHGSTKAVPMSNTALGLSGYLTLAVLMSMLSLALLLTPPFTKKSIKLKT